jgi:hypothetical protein
MRLKRATTKRYWPYVVAIASSGFFIDAAMLGQRNNVLVVPVLVLASALAIYSGIAFKARSVR